MPADEAVVRDVARQLLLGLRESLSIAGQLAAPVDVVNQVLHRLQDACNGCIELVRPYAGEPRVVVTVVDWASLKRAAGISQRPQ